MVHGRSWIISLALHLALLLGVAAWIGEEKRVDEGDEPVPMSCSILYSTWKFSEIQRLRDVYEYRGEIPPEFLDVTLALQESWVWQPEGATLFLYFSGEQAPCPQCIRMMQDAFGEHGRRKVVVPRVVAGRVTGTYVGWSSSLGLSDPRPRHPGGCRAFHLLGVDVYCTCCSIPDQRASAIGQKPR